MNQVPGPSVRTRQASGHRGFVHKPHVAHGVFLRDEPEKIPPQELQHHAGGFCVHHSTACQSGNATKILKATSLALVLSAKQRLTRIGKGECCVMCVMTKEVNAVRPTLEMMQNVKADDLSQKERTTVAPLVPYHGIYSIVCTAQYEHERHNIVPHKCIALYHTSIG